VEAEYFINFPVLASHNDGGITVCGKNHYGSLLRSPADAGYYDEHWTRATEQPNMGSYRCIVDLFGHEEMGGKTLLFLVDGLIGGVSWYHGPVKWEMFPFDTDWTESIFISQDPVAIDSVCFDLMYTEYDDGASYPYDYPRKSGTEDYLHEAAQASDPPSGVFYDPEEDSVAMQNLGVHEHWNDSSKKQYTRNLETGNGIELIGVMLDLAGQASSPSPGDTATGVYRTVDLSWTAGPDALSHDVYLGTDATAVATADHSSPEFKGNQSGVTYDPGTLDSDVTYYWAIDEVHGAQVWPGAVWSFTTVNRAPDVPSVPSPADEATDQSIDVDLGWVSDDPDGDPVTYDLYLGKDVLPGTPAATGLTSPSYDPGTLDGHTTYHWKVVAKDDQGGQSAGPEWTFTTLNRPPETPSSPSPADGAPHQDVEVDLSWAACSDPDGDPVTYDLYLGQDSLPGTPTATGLTSPGYDPGTLDGHATYHWKVVAKDDQTGEAAGPEWTFSTGNRAPATPADPSPADDAVDQELDVDLSWSECTDPDSDPVTYDLYFGKDVLPGTPTATGLTSPSYEPGTLDGHSTYHWKVVAKDDQGGEAAGPEWSFTTLNQVPETPSNPSPSDGAKNQSPDVDLSWSACTDPDGDAVTYDLYLGVGSLPGSPTASGLSSPGYDPGTLQKRTDYVWQVVAKDGLGGEAEGPAWSFRTGNR
jgi:hypothetical protein